MREPDREPVLTLRGVSVRYDTAEDWVGSGLDLDIAAGETVLLLGPSGCGKSTLLLAMSGLIPTSADAELRGRVVCAGIDTATAHPGQLAAHVGMVFQDPDAQVVTNTLLDEVCFGLENLLVPAPEIEARALPALQRVGLANTREEALLSPAALSGGGRQRLAIACALALDPELLILDEPTANLDPAASAEFYATLAELRDGTRTTILVEHELDDALPLADRVIVLDHAAELIADGAPADVFGRHAALLRRHGVWLPTATEIALRSAPDALPLPLTLPELADRLAAKSIATDTPVETPRGGDRTGRDGERTDVVARTVDAAVALGGQVVLEGVDLEIRRGEFLAVAGTNGAGKSTLTRALAGLAPLRSGRVELEGVPLGSLDARQIGDRVGYVFQNPEHQFVTRTVADELGYGLRVRRRDEDEIAAAVAAMLERFDLARYAKVNPFLLSHGEKRRLSVATALITEPGILILDEPTFGQDRARAEEIIALVDELNATGITIVMVTHDLQLVADHAHRLAILADAHLLEVGPAAALLRNADLIERAGLRQPPIPRLARMLARSGRGWEHLTRSDQLLEAQT
ncbi:ABC transporter ATP-binding protein [Gulosibacter sp. 10]|uniref:ABC transporter ATP-binding protein n=1 Tax=Gulosibacter sp. 10 TaxID=1255570 RepID=UPI00097EA0C5|nr:energy-coupling factor transporter ATPase [Gulosibacter sp. 10]SJM58136.1 Duplicated ATPase component YkoD of energizing module of thiamin-regulated ECF transporter for HydroxyMethylPyrimidine [Gulosibacter sp. 10]